MINKAILLGNLGADPESRTTNSGSTVTNLRVATSARVKRGDSWEDETTWHRVVCFGKTAENAARFLAKGRQVYVEGRTQHSEYTDKDGNRRWSTEVIADVIKFVGGKGDSGGDRGGSYGGSRRNSGPSDDIPF